MWDGILINISKPSLISIFLARNTMIKPVIKLSLHFCSSYKFVRKDNDTQTLRQDGRVLKISIEISAQSKVIIDTLSLIENVIRISYS